MKRLRLQMIPQQRRLREALVWILLTIITIVIVSGVVSILTYRKNQEILQLRALNESIIQEVSTFDDLVRQKRDGIERKKELEQRCSKVQRMAKLGEQAPSNMLEELVELIPPHVTLESFVLDGKRLTIKGHA